MAGRGSFSLRIVLEKLAIVFGIGVIVLDLLFIIGASQAGMNIQDALISFFSLGLIGGLLILVALYSRRLRLQNEAHDSGNTSTELDSPENALLTIKIKHSLFGFIYSFVTPTVNISGERLKKKWGSHTFELQPGQYHIEVSYPWIFNPECGKNSVDLQLQSGDKKALTYTARFIRYFPGKIKII